MDEASARRGPLGAADSRDQSTIRWSTAELLLDRAEIIVADTVAVFPFGGPRRLEVSYCVSLGDLFLRVLADAVRSGRCDARTGAVADFVGRINDRSLTPEQVFTFVYLALTTAIDELSLDPQVGATTEPWPRVTDIVRRAAFDVLAAVTARMIDEPTEAAITDTLTTLHTRAVLEAALQKECQRAERFEHWLSFVLIDVDNLGDINRAHGYGVGDRVLERLGILLRIYYRQHDWVARYAEDAIAVLLPETGPDDARTLAERTRVMVQDRLTFRDHRTDQRAVVTVSVAVVSARAREGVPVDARTVIAAAEARLAAARQQGGNRVDQIEIIPPDPPRTGP